MKRSRLTNRPGGDGLGLLGIAQRAGAVIRGVGAVRRALNAEELELVICAADAADGQLAKVSGLLRHRDVPRRWAKDRATLGRAVGAPPLSVVGVTIRSFAEPLQRSLPAGRGGFQQSEEEPGFDAGR